MTWTDRPAGGCRRAAPSSPADLSPAKTSQSAHRIDRADLSAPALEYGLTYQGLTLSVHEGAQITALFVPRNDDLLRFIQKGTALSYWIRSHIGRRQQACFTLLHDPRPHPRQRIHPTPRQTRSPRAQARFVAAPGGQSGALQDGSTPGRRISSAETVGRIDCCCECRRRTGTSGVSLGAHPFNSV